jgi:hypothetical protein
MAYANKTGSTMKDWLIERTVSGILNLRFLKLYGKITELKIDSTNKSLQLELELKGEPQKLWIYIHRYELIEQSGEMQFVIKEISISREWINALAQEFVLNKPFPVTELIGNCFLRGRLY